MKRWLVVALLVCGVGSVLGVAQAAAGDGFGLGAGIVKVKDSDSSNLWLTANLRVHMAPNLAIEPEGGWYRDSDGSDKLDVINAGGSLLLVAPTERVDLWGGGGAGAHFYRLSLGGQSATETKLGLHVLGGVDLKASPTLRLFGAVRYEFIRVGDGAPSMKQWKIYGGLRFTSGY